MQKPKRRKRRPGCVGDGVFFFFLLVCCVFWRSIGGFSVCVFCVSKRKGAGLGAGQIKRRSTARQFERQKERLETQRFSFANRREEMRRQQKKKRKEEDQNKASRNSPCTFSTLSLATPLRLVLSQRRRREPHPSRERKKEMKEKKHSGEVGGGGVAALRARGVKGNQ